VLFINPHQAGDCSRLTFARLLCIMARELQWGDTLLLSRWSCIVSWAYEMKLFGNFVGLVIY
jgi:hypothetical protein